MFTPLVQGKESRIVDGGSPQGMHAPCIRTAWLTLPYRLSHPPRADNHLIVPGRFRARLAVVNGDSNGLQRVSAYGTHYPGSSSPVVTAAASRRGGRKRTTSNRLKRIRTTASEEERDTTTNPTPSRRQADERTWLLRPSRDKVETWLDAWWKRWVVLVLVPSLIVSCTNVEFPRGLISVPTTCTERMGELIVPDFHLRLDATG